MAKKYPQPTNEDYLSYYVYQRDWKPTRPVGTIGAMSSSPGPAIVNLPSTIGEERHDPTKAKAPGYKIGHRVFKDSISTAGPGPAAYNIQNITNNGKETSKAPKIGTAKRFSDKRALAATSPGPAAYNRQLGDRYIYHRAPAYSVPKAQRGKSTSDKTPGPAAYSLPPVFGPGKTPVVVGPAFSVGKAKRMADAKVQLNPGPAAYMLPSSNLYMNKAPAFTIGSKAVPPRGFVHSPGPAAHGTHLVKYDKYSAPRITFGIRHSPYKAIPGFTAQK